MSNRLCVGDTAALPLAMATRLNAWKYTSPHLCYYAKSGHSRLNISIVIMDMIFAKFTHPLVYTPTEAVPLRIS